ncbi:hypothetical protein JHK82_049959 [Glycine max]|uniref:Uncharacterized protein n=1 Tax=Glycine soja TaxID=3848 RepID=A0A445FRV1_GLYSO|nr:hypothetical protein JHK86_049835 [Glycine max]KAG5091181.1 hypothetical protein JHK82_049959 [Glycine max]RZB51599.1 hypothetical protein D0Y65_048144 [Glycine soja]
MVEPSDNHHEAEGYLRSGGAWRERVGEREQQGERGRIFRLKTTYEKHHRMSNEETPLFLFCSGCVLLSTCFFLLFPSPLPAFSCLTLSPPQFSLPLLHTLIS